MYVWNGNIFVHTYVCVSVHLHVYVWEDQTVTVYWYINLVVNRFIKQ